MTSVIPIEDGSGGAAGDRSPMSGGPGSHVVYAKGCDLVVEWYDFGEHSPYESANLLIFGRAAQLNLAAALEADPSLSPHLLSSWVAARFASYFEVREFAIARDIPFEAQVDFDP